MHVGKIGVLDPGFAGLVILRSVAERLPLHDYIYLACGVNDQAAEKAANKLLAEGCKIIIVPNAHLFNHLQSQIPSDLLLGSAVPIAKMATQQTHSSKIGIITHEDTKYAELYAAEMRKLRPDIQTYQQACPLLVPLIEAGRQYTQAIEAVLHGYLTPLLHGGVDVLVLGSLHYDLIREEIEQFVGSSAHVIGQGTAVATDLADDLARHDELEKSMSKQQLRQFYCVHESKKSLEAMAHQYFGSAIDATEIIL